MRTRSSPRRQLALSLLDEAPRAHTAFQHFVMAATRIIRDQHKRSWFGRDPVVLAYKNFYDKLRNVNIALELDGVISSALSDIEFIEAFTAYFNVFKTAYPAWQDGYQAIDEVLFVDRSENEVASIFNRHRQ